MNLLRAGLGPLPENLLMSAPSFGKYVRKQRLALRDKDASFSLRQVAMGAGLEPSFLSKIERGISPPPSEAKIKALAKIRNSKNRDMLHDYY